METTPPANRQRERAGGRRDAQARPAGVPRPAPAGGAPQGGAPGGGGSAGASAFLRTQPQEGNRDLALAVGLVDGRVGADSSDAEGGRSLTTRERAPILP